jgi:phage/plasmid-like protein (TIGR03299 family)
MHELTTNSRGQVEFAYLTSDGQAWHGLGQGLPDHAPHDAWIQAAGMDWKILRSKVRYAVDRTGDTNQYLELPEKHVLFRSDDKAPLGVCSDRYKVVQPREVLEFFKDIVKVGGLQLSAAGTVFGGKRFWATAKIGEACPTSVKDKIGGYLLLSTSADGSLATEVRLTSIRVVCRNTLAMATADKSQVKVSHRSTFRPDEVKAFMGLNETAWAAFKHSITRLANKQVNKELAEELTFSLLGSEDKVRGSAAYNKILDLFNGDGQGSTLDGVYGTAWGFVNSVTEYVDHFTRARSDANRFVSSQWGAGAAMKNDALKLALSI